MTVEGVLMSLVVGLLRKGKLIHFGLVQIKGAFLFVIGALIQFIVFRYAKEDGGAGGVSSLLFSGFYVLHVLSYICITIPPLIINHTYKSLYVMAVGTLLNLIPIAFNHGQMPVKLPAVYEPAFDLGHTLLVAETKMKFLSDIIFIGPPYPLPKILSLGDLFLIVGGVFWFIQQIMVNKELNTKLTDL